VGEVVTVHVENVVVVFESWVVAEIGAKHVWLGHRLDELERSLCGKCFDHGLPVFVPSRGVSVVSCLKLLRLLVAVVVKTSSPLR
jgi:hypothetical protein